MKELDNYVEMDVAPLTDWANEPSCRDLKANFQAAIPHHNSHVSEVDGWLDYLNITGSARMKPQEGRSSVQPKLIRKQAEWRYASLSEAFLGSSDVIKARGVTWEDRESAEQNQIVLNHQWNNEIDKVRFVDEYVRTAVNEGTVVVRVGWDFYEDEMEVPDYKQVPIRDPQKLAEIEQAMMMIEQAQDQNIINSLDPYLAADIELSMSAGYPVTLEYQGTKKELRTIRNRPTVEVCDYKSLMIDPTCKGDISKASFIIYQFETSRSELEKSGNYSNLEKINIDRNSIQTGESLHSEDVGAFNFEDEARKKFYAYEYWGYWDIDNSGRTKPIVATWVGDTLIRMEASPFPDEGLPFVSVQYLPRRKSVYGEPDGELLKDNQKIAGAVTRGMIDIMGRSANGQTGMRKDALDITNQRKFDQGKDYLFNGHVDPRMAFYQHVYPEIPQSAPFMLELQNIEAEALTGVKAFRTGISGKGLGDSATAVNAAMDAAGLRELGILRRLADGIVRICYKIAAMNADFLDDEQIVRLTNDKYQRVRRDDLAGRIDIKLEVATSESDNIRAQELAFMLQTMGNSVPPDFARIILAELFKLRKMPDLARMVENYQPQPDPAQEQMQMLEMAEIQARIKKLESEAMENMAEAGLDQAKAMEAQSKAAKQDLDFVEQRSGTAHQRDLDKQGAQAQANERLEATKAFFNNQGSNSE